MNGPSTPPQNLRHARKSLKKNSFKMGDIVNFTHLNGKESYGEILKKMPNKSLPQKWRVFNINSNRKVVVPENKITFLHSYSAWN